jgi:hypothetical protein
MNEGYLGFDTDNNGIRVESKDLAALLFLENDTNILSEGKYVGTGATSAKEPLRRFVEFPEGWSVWTFTDDSALPVGSQGICIDANGYITILGSNATCLDHISLIREGEVE